MNRLISSNYAPLILVICVFFGLPDFLSIILNGMPIEEGGKYYAANGWAYLGRDLDFYREGTGFFPNDSIWSIMPLEFVLPQIQELLFIGGAQLICFILLIRYFYFNHRIFTVARQNIEFSQGKSLVLSFFFILIFGLILFSIETLYFVFFKKDFIFDNFVSISIIQQKLSLHPLYFIVFLIVGCLGAAIFEETLFRRILFPLLRKKMPFFLSALLNSLLFASFHDLNWMIFAQTFICGIICCVIYEHTKSAIGCIVFHFAGNFCLLILPVIYPLDVFR